MLMVVLITYVFLHGDVMMEKRSLSCDLEAAIMCKSSYYIHTMYMHNYI